MKLSKFAIENHQFTMVMVCLLVLAGVVSFINMPRSEDPPVQPAGSSVIVIYPGGTPADMEQLVVDPVERVINELDDIRKLESSAEDGLARVAVEFMPGSDPDEKYSDVVQKVNSIRDELPDNIVYLELLKWTVSDVHIFQLALSSDSAGYASLENEAERLKRRIERISDVKKVEIWANPQQEVRVSVDLEKLALLRIPLRYVMAAIQDANTNLPGGHVDVGTRRLNIKTSGSYQSVEDIRHTLIHSQGGKAVYLKDVADVEFAYEDEIYRARYMGKRSLFITVNQKERTNIFQIAGRVKPLLEEFKTELPQNMSLGVVFDQSESVSHRVSGFFTNLLQGIFLVGIVIFTAVGWRAALIVMLAIPVSNLIGIGFVDQSGFGLEQMSIAGLVIALGLLVDNAIVVTENIARYMKLGLSRKDAAVKGTQEVGWAVVSATATTVFAFIPIIMMQDVTGDFIRSMPVTVVYTLTASLIISLTLTPYLSSRFLRVNSGKKERPLRKRLNGFIEHRYRKILGFGLRKPVLTVTISFVVFLSSLGLFPLIGVSFFPKADKPQFFININLAEGTSLDKTDQVTRDVEAYLSEIDLIRHFAVNVGHGNPRLYYNVFPKRHKSGHAQIFVQLKENDQKQLQTIVADIRKAFSDYPGAEISVKELEQGPDMEAPIAIKVLGDNLEILKRLAAQVEAIVRGQEGAINVNNPLGTTKSDLQVRINREKANMLGVALSEIDVTVRAAVNGLPVSQYRDPNGEEHDIVLRMPFNGKPALSDFDRIHVASRSGRLVPLKQVARLEMTASPLTISHFQMERSVTVTADIEGRQSANAITRQIIRQLDEISWPKGYDYHVGGELESQGNSFGGMTKAIIIAIIAIFGVLVLQFRCYLQPLIVFSALPLAMIGSILALLITGNSFSFTAFIGLTSLVGIVVNNSIILVDYSNQLRREGKSVNEAVSMAGETRFIPIILTTATTIGGLLPLTLGGGTMWAPMGWTIIGGLLTSTILTLFIVPVLYKLFTFKNSHYC